MVATLVSILANLADQTAAFVPNLIGAVILLVIGLVLGKIVGRAVNELLIRIKLDYYVHETKKPAVSFTNLFALIVRWWIYIAFIAQAVEVLGLLALQRWFSQIVGFIPNVIGAALIIAAGYVLGEYARGHMKSTNKLYGHVVGKVMFFFIIYVAVALALPILGIPATLVNNILLVIVGSVGLGLAIALGLGLKDAVSMVSKKYVKNAKL